MRCCSTNHLSDEQIPWPFLRFLRLELTTCLLIILGHAATAQDSTAINQKKLKAITAAKMLANPSASIAFFSIPADYIQYSGKLPDASQQNAFKVNLQPSILYRISKNGTNLFFRPLVPIHIKQPVPQRGGGYENKGINLGNISFDADVGKTFPNKLALLVGIFGTIPTATDPELSIHQWLLGPEVFVGYDAKWGFLGLLVTQEFRIAGNSQPNTSIMSGQYFYTINLKKAWQIQSQPVWAYVYNAQEGNKLSLPLGIGIAKTTIPRKMPLKFALQYWYYIVSPEIFGPKHQVRFQITPTILFHKGK